jgi:hypothetical protein
MKTKTIIGLCILVIFISGCSQKIPPKEYAQDELLTVIYNHIEFKQFNEDFKAAHSGGFAPGETEIIRLNKTVIRERTKLFESDSSTKAFAEIYDDLPSGNNLFEVWLADREDIDRMIIAVVNMETRSLLKFYAVVRIKTYDINLQR